MDRREDHCASPADLLPLPPDDPVVAARLVTLSHDLMGALDARGRFVWANPAWERTLGWEPHTLAGMPYAELLHPDDRDRAREAELALAGGASHWPELELRVRTREGDHRWFLFSLVHSEHERRVYLSGKDVSARNEESAERSVLYARYRALVSNLPDAIVTKFDPELRIVVVEGGQLASRGLDPNAYAGRLLSETIPADRYAELEPRLRAALAGKPQAFDLQSIDAGLTYRVQAVPLHTEDGRLLGGMMVSRDITERRRHEEALAARAEELERSNAELAQFAYVASHDLSEPLRMISSYLQLLRRRYRGQLDADADAFIDYAVEGANRMRTLIEDLLAYSRAGRSERPPEPVDTGELVAAVAETLRARTGGEAPLVEWGDLPTVRGDAPQLTQLFQNLIGNGVKFVAPGTRPHVRIGAVRGDACWRFTVDDNGIGIDRRHAEQVFGMFQRLHSRDEFPGSGIGLAIAKKVVEQHGGTIRAEARPEGGTRFEFTVADPPEVA
jgi:PAS domain S-box-containing protein